MPDPPHLTPRNGDGGGYNGCLFAFFVIGALVLVIANIARAPTRKDTATLIETMAVRETVTIPVDARGPKPELYVLSAFPETVSCDISAPAKIIDVKKKNRSWEVVDGEVWELMFRISAPSSGEYEVRCDASSLGVAFGIRQP
ncbi:hypothetical protein [Nonomuraea endophytica]|uniref:hypothetical protein n=1 Tax=Nonomuraea endophytica TaxID=714136 RepID=UPI0037C99A18